MVILWNRTLEYTEYTDIMEYFNSMFNHNVVYPTGTIEYNTLNKLNILNGN